MSAHPSPGVPGAIASRGRHSGVLLAALSVLSLTVAGCGSGSDGTAAPAPGAGTPSTVSSETFVISAIPDQDPEKLQRLYGTVATYLSRTLGVPVEYEPVVDYPASVSLFRVGDLDMVWFGGLTGVQARIQTPGSKALLQRDVDEDFRSVFIVNTATGLAPVTDGAGLAQLKGRRFTFGSESSTSGRLMPEFFLGEAGVGTSDFAGQPGFSGSHDRTIELVTAGTFEAGVLNEQVWKARLAEGRVDRGKVTAFYTTPGYHDYHWVARQDSLARYGPDFESRLVQAFVDLDAADPEQATILELFTATRFIPTADENYGEIEKVGRKLGLVT
ncbi:MAG TPA: putative selenate ABC transporter substrate-binding protein [Acidimicrobiales bacterium]|nr:putative selenate ABC transporter substrate-binding protein [Acidimicrobiales bacterium]